MLPVHLTPSELILSAMTAGMVLLVLAAELKPGNRGEEDEPQDRDDEPGAMLAAA